MPELSWPEPGPNWPEAKETWKSAWPVHRYLFASIWAMAATYFVFFFVKSTCQYHDGQKRTPFIILSLQLLGLAVTRCFMLFVNPYGSKSNTKAVLVTGITVWSLGTAGLTSAFGILLLILLDTTKLNIAPPKFQNLKVLIIITAAIFTFIVVADVVVAFYDKAKILLLLCNTILALWGVLTAIGYFIVAHRTRRNLFATFQGIAAQSQESKNCSIKLRRLVIKSYVSSFLGFGIFSLALYTTIFGGGSILSDAEYVDSWTWLAFQTTFRILEVLITAFITFIALQTRSR